MAASQSKKDYLILAASFLWLIALWSAYRFFLEPVLSAFLAPIGYAVAESLIKLMIYGSPAVYLIVKLGERLALSPGRLFRFPKEAVLYGPILSGVVAAAFLAINFLKNGGRLSLAEAGAGEVITTVFAAAVTEELFFRGWMLNALLKKLPDWGAYLATAGAFVLVHYPIWIMTGQSAELLRNSISVFLIGLLFGAVFKLSKSLWPSMMLHAAYNFCVLFLSA